MRLTILWLSRLNRLLSEAGVVVACALLILMTGSVLAQVASRELRAPIGWTEEVALSAMVWIAFLCGPWAYRNHQFTRIDVLTEALPARSRHALEVAVHLLELAILIGALWFAWRFYLGGRASLPAITQLVRDVVTPFVGAEAARGVTVRNFVVYAVVPTGFAGLLLVNLEHILRAALTVATGRDHRVGLMDDAALAAGGEGR
jgi:TRAP-type C4-dicarboxylate transport system permease small subunit